MRLDKGEEIMSYYNTIRLLKGTAFLTTREYKNFEPGDTIWGNDSDAEEISRWNEDEKEKALDALKKYKCSYQESNGMYDIEEYALEYFDSDEDGEFVAGSDYDIAETD